MPHSNRTKIDVTNKTGHDFDHWLLSNISDEHHRNWYRNEAVSSKIWLDKLEREIYQEKINKARLDKYSQHW